MKPMLAAPVKPAQIRYPIYATPKLDGVRGLIKAGKVLSRKLLEIPNRYAQEMFGDLYLEGMDGELILGNPTDKNAFRKTSSFLARADAKISNESLVFWAFDLWNSKLSYVERMGALAHQIKHCDNPF